MADPKKLDLHIETTADTSGADAAQAAINKTVDAADDTAASVSKIGASAQKTAEEIGQVGKSMEDTARDNSNNRGFGGMLEAHERQMEARRKEAEATLEAEKKLAEAAKQTTAALKDGERGAGAGGAGSSPAGKVFGEGFDEDFENEKKAIQARMRDLVNEARQNKADREVAAQQSDQRADALGLAARGAAVLGVREVAKQASEEVKKLNEELVRMGGESSIAAESFVEAMEFITNPLEATTKGVFNLITAGARKAFDDLRASREQADAMQRRLDDLIESRRKLEQEARQSAFATILQNERQEIENQTAAMERQMRILRARRELLSAQADLQDQEALAAGEDPNVVAARSIVRKAEADQAALRDELVRAERALEESRAGQQQATDLLFELKDRGASAADIERARQGLAEADNKVSQAAAAVADLQTEIDTLSEAIQTRTTAAIGKLQGDVDSNTTASLQALKQALEQKAAENAEELKKELEKKGKETTEELKKDLEEKSKESGLELSSTARAAYEELARILSDNIPDSEQVNEIGRILQLVKSSRDEVDGKIIAGLTASLAADEVLARKINELQEQQAILRRSLNRR